MSFAQYDTGVVNLITIYIPEKRPIIFSGKPIVNLNNRFKSKISKLQSKYDEKNIASNIKEKLKKRMKQMWTKREHKINYMFHKMSKTIMRLRRTYAKNKK